MKNNKLDIFEQNAEFFERFNNSLEDTAEDRHDRTRFTVTGLENKVEFAVTNAQGKIKKAEDDAVDRLNHVNGMTNDELISKSVGAGKWMREGAYGLGARFLNGQLNQIGVKDLSNTMYNGFVLIKPDQPELSSGRLERFMGNLWRSGITSDRFSGFLVNENSALRAFVYSHHNGGTYSEIYHKTNVRTDANGVMHSGTIKPLNTLNTSDMSDTVVDRDDVTVTSGAVYRALANSGNSGVFKDLIQIQAKKDTSGSCLFLTDKDGNSRVQITYLDLGIQIIQVLPNNEFQVFTFPHKSGEVALKSDLDELRAEIALLKGKLNE